MSTYLGEILAILNRDDQQEASLFTIFRADVPAACDCESEIEDVLIAGRIYGQHGVFDIPALLKIAIDLFETLSGGAVDYVSVVDDRSERNWQWDRRQRGGRGGG